MKSSKASVAYCIIDKTFAAPNLLDTFLEKDYMPIHKHQTQALTSFDQWNVDRSNTCYFWSETLRCSIISLFYQPYQ